MALHSIYLKGSGNSIVTENKIQYSHEGVWELEVRNIFVTGVIERNSLFAISCNLVQHEQRVSVNSRLQLIRESPLLALLPLIKSNDSTIWQDTSPATPCITEVNYMCDTISVEIIDTLTRLPVEAAIANRLTFHVLLSIRRLR